MSQVTISKREYQKLLERALRFEYLREILEEDIFSPPPTRNIKTIIKKFHATGRYNENFLNSLTKGLKRSSYFK